MLRTLIHNWHLKLLSVVSAFGLWLLIVNTDTTRVAIAAIVEYVGLRSDLVVVGGRREAVEIELEAARWAAARLTPDSVRVRVDLTGMTRGESVVPLSPDRVDVPSGVTVTRITPAWLRVTVDEAGVRSVRVLPQIRGNPAPDHAIQRVVVDPPTVQVKGPRLTIEAHDTVDTVPVDVSGSQADITQTIGLVLPEAVYLTRERAVQVTVEIRPAAAATPPGKRGSK
jgi:YbbR domain-containing protein